MRVARKRRLLALSVLAAAAAACGGGYNDSIAYTGVTKATDVPTTVADVLEGDEQQRFTTFLSLVDTAGLDDALSDTGPLTVFAPTNEAFGRDFDAAELQSLSQNVRAVEDLVGLHVATEDVTFSRPPYVVEVEGERGPELRVDGRLPLDQAGLQIVDDAPVAVPTLEGHTVVVKPTRTVTGPNTREVPVIDADMRGPNGFIQVIDGVLDAPAGP